MGLWLACVICQTRCDQVRNLSMRAPRRAHLIAFFERQREALEKFRAINRVEQPSQADVLCAVPSAKTTAHGNEMCEVRLLGVLNVVNTKPNKVVGHRLEVGLHALPFTPSPVTGNF